MKNLIPLRVGTAIPNVLVPSRLSANGDGGEQMMTMMIDFKANMLAMRWQYDCVAGSSRSFQFVRWSHDRMVLLTNLFEADVLAMGRRYKA